MNVANELLKVAKILLGFVPAVDVTKKYTIGFGGVYAIVESSMPKPTVPDSLCKFVHDAKKVSEDEKRKLQNLFGKVSFSGSDLDFDSDEVKIGTQFVIQSDDPDQIVLELRKGGYRSF